MSEKELLLTDMKNNPTKYNREKMFRIIYEKILTEQDLVVNSNILTKSAYEHILRYPRLSYEQRPLPISKLSNPQSFSNFDVYFFGVPGSGKSCLLAGLMSLTGYFGFKFNPKGNGGRGSYAMELRNYGRTSMLLPRIDQDYIQVIDSEICDENNHHHKISLIEMSGEKIARFAAVENAVGIEDLDPVAAGLLSNDNNKALFFVIDPTNEKQIQLDNGTNYSIKQSEVLNSVLSLLSKNKAIMKRVVAINVILTKSDTLGNAIDRKVIQNVLDSQGYTTAIENLRGICDKYDINRQTGYHVGIYPFCLGKFMPGDVYEFDNTDSIKILRFIANAYVGPCPACSSRYRKTFWDRLTSRIAEWANS